MHVQYVCIDCYKSAKIKKEIYKKQIKWKCWFYGPNHMTMSNQSLLFCWTYSNNCQQVNAHWGVYKVIHLQRLTPLIINEESKSTLTAFSIIIPQCLFCFVYGWSPTCSQLYNLFTLSDRHKIKERGKSRSWRTEKNRKFRNNIFRDSSYYIRYFALEQNIFFLNLK